MNQGTQAALDARDCGRSPTRLTGYVRTCWTPVPGPRLDLTEVVTARASPCQNGYCERVIGTLRRECLDHVVAIDEHQLQHVLDSYVRYYNRTRTHLALAKDTPEGRRVATPASGRVVSIAEVGGLHHRYERLAA